MKQTSLLDFIYVQTSLEDFGFKFHRENTGVQKNE